MRKTLLTLCTLLCAMFATTAQAQNLLENGGFEDWTDSYPTNWLSSSSASTKNAVSQSEDARSGAYSVQVVGASSSNKRIAYKEITLKAGTYHFSAFIKSANAGEEGVIRIGYTPVDADNNAGTYMYEDGNHTATDSWQEISWDFTLDESTRLCLLFMNNKKPGKSVLIDDASLTTEDGGIDNSGEEPTPPALEEVSGLAEAKTVATGKDYIINLNNAVVTYVNGANAYIEDGNAGMLVYKSNHGLVAGQSISGKVTAKLALYNNLYELTTFDTSNATITDGAEIPETTVTLAELQANFAKYESMRVKVEGATATSAFESRYAYINQDGTEMTLYQRDANAEFTFAADNRVDVVGYPGLFKDAQQLNVWEVSDVTVLGEEPPTPPVVELEELENLAEAKYREDGEYIINLENAIVTYVNGKNAYIEDGETGILIFLEEGHTLEAGQCISGKVVAKVTDYYGLCELESFDTTDAVITDGAEIPETTVTVEELLANPKKYESRRVKVVEAVAESAFTNRNANVKQDGHTLSLYQKDANAKFTFAEGDKMDVVGYLGAFREEIQLNVWEESDVTIYAVDGIGQITNGQNDVQIYTLDGRRVQKATKGIYIVNGKKMVAK